jgi:hypothetical protein
MREATVKDKFGYHGAFETTYTGFSFVWRGVGLEETRPASKPTTAAEEKRIVNVQDDYCRM